MYARFQPCRRNARRPRCGGFARMGGLGGMGGLFGGGRGGRRGSPLMRIGIAVVIALFALTTYYCSTQSNPMTGGSQRVGNITPDQEIAMGLQAVPGIVAQFDGISRDATSKSVVQGVGQRLLPAIAKVHAKTPEDNPYPFEFTLLDDDETVNAFALPGGQTFVTEALFREFTREDQLAAVMGHEMAHVIFRHGAERMARENLNGSLTMAATFAKGDMSGGAVAQMMLRLVSNGYSREQEAQADHWGLLYMAEAGYDPQGMIGLLEVLEKQDSGPSPPKYFSTHPRTPDRIEAIRELIARIDREGLNRVIESSSAALRK